MEDGMAGNGRRIRLRFGLCVAAWSIVACAAAPLAQAESETIAVVLDQAKLVKLPEKVATLVIGNPLIVDATLQTGGAMVLTGKGYGATNVMALDRSGEILMEKIVHVQAPREAVVVYRGVARETLSCAPTCQPQIVLGDAEAAFNLALGQTVARNTQAQAAAR
jgi:Flp pilus assembly secretin CpaC